MSTKVMRFKGSKTASLSDLKPNKLYQLNFNIAQDDYEEIKLIDEVDEIIYIDKDYLNYFEEVQNTFNFDLKVFIGTDKTYNNLKLEKDKVYQINYYIPDEYDYVGYIITDQGTRINLTSEDMKQFKNINYLQDQLKIKEKSIENYQNEINLINNTTSKYQFDAVIMVIFNREYNSLSEDAKQLFSSVNFKKVYPMFYNLNNQEYWIFDGSGNKVITTNYQHYFKNYNFDKEQNEKCNNNKEINEYKKQIADFENIKNFLGVETYDDIKEEIIKLKDDNIVTDNVLLDKEKLIDDLYVKIEKLHKIIKSLIDLV